jgi:hypothetical protein
MQRVLRPRYRTASDAKGEREVLEPEPVMCKSRGCGTRARAAPTTAAERVPPLSFDASFVRGVRRASKAARLMTLVGGGPQHPPRTKAEGVGG